MRSQLMKNKISLSNHTEQKILSFEEFEMFQMIANYFDLKGEVDLLTTARGYVGVMTKKKVCFSLPVIEKANYLSREQMAFLLTFNVINWVKNSKNGFVIGFSTSIQKVLINE